mmetsp:Transcript_2131/g.4956  ORF Transcript_2131/g.4956 Transcript_2131/m.4956 type:complete len:243 (-) Transcript_2131:116-844(-)|eukprot:g15049.t1
MPALSSLSAEHTTQHIGSEFCVFDYPGHSIRRPPFAENFVVGTDFPQWLRQKLDHIQSGSVGEALEGGTSHPLLVFKEPCRKVHVKIEDATDGAHHHYRKVLWDQFFEKGTQFVRKTFHPLFKDEQTKRWAPDRTRTVELPPVPAIMPPELLGRGSPPPNPADVVVSIRPPAIGGHDETRTRLKMKVTCEGVYSGQFRDSGLGLKPQITGDVDEELFFDLVRSPRARCPTLLPHPLATVSML